jgi:hypothetical protein
MSNVYVFDLNTLTWYFPLDAQINAPSRRCHGAIVDNDMNRVVFWGGRRHDFTQVYPDETWFLYLPDPNTPTPNPGGPVVNAVVYPGLIAARNAIGILYAAIVAATLGTLGYARWIQKDSEVQYTAIVVPVLGIGDFLSHVVLVFVCAATNFTAPMIAATVCMGLALTANVVLVRMHMRFTTAGHRSSDRKYVQYRKDHPVGTSVPNADINNELLDFCLNNCMHTLPALAICLIASKSK